MANYYLSIDNQRRGPFPEEELVGNGMTPDSLVWRNGMDQWKRAAEVPELAQYLGLMPQIPELPQNPAQYGQPQYPQGQYPQYPQGQYPQYPQYAQGQYQQEYDEDEYVPPCPYNYLVWAILTTIFCCVPFGIVAIVKASRVEGLYDDKRYDESEEMSRGAKNWIIAGVVAGIFSLIIWIIIQIYTADKLSSYNYYY